MDKLQVIIKKKASILLDETIRLRRHFHMYPELSFREKKTADFICSYLDDKNIEYINNLADTGIIAWINGSKGDGIVVALRAELDALPLIEKTGLEYSSRNEGVMHACGHDAHLAILLSSASIIKDINNEFGGTIVFIFQPGEEMAPGGARLLMETKAFKDIKPDLLIAQHVLPGLKSGMTGFKPGIYMASSDEIHIKVKGRGGHAALPDESSDQVRIGSELVVKLKKKIDDYPTDKPLVLGIGRFIADGATNVIPPEVFIQGTIRTFDEIVRSDIKKIVEEECKNTAERYKVSIDLKIPDGYPVLENSVEYVMRAFDLAGEINGKKMVTKLDRRMSSEDFAYFSQKYPVVFYRLGISNESEGKNGLHTSNFTLDEKAMMTGVRTLSYLGLKLTENKDS